MSTELPPLKREKLLEGLDLKDLSMADVQSLLHWANNRCCYKAPNPIASNLKKLSMTGINDKQPASTQTR